MIALCNYEIATEEWPRFKAALRLLRIPALDMREVQLRHYYNVIHLKTDPTTMKVGVWTQANDSAQITEVLASLGFTPLAT